MNFPWLTVSLLLPLAGAVAVMLVPKPQTRTAKRVALGFAVATFLLVAGLTIGYLVPRLVRVDHARSVASSFEVGVHNSTLAIAVAVSVLGSSALAVPAAGGVRRSFGTEAKSLQVGFAAEAGIRAADLVAAGATADPSVVDLWLELVGGTQGSLDAEGPAVPGGLAIKMYPACYALQRPTAAVAELAADVDPDAVRRVVVRTPAGTVAPLIHSRPRTGLEGKFSIEYVGAATLLDGKVGIDTFTDVMVQRPEVRAMMKKVRRYRIEDSKMYSGEGSLVCASSLGAVGSSLASPRCSSGSRRSVTTCCVMALLNSLYTR